MQIHDNLLSTFTFWWWWFDRRYSTRSMGPIGPTKMIKDKQNIVQYFIFCLLVLIHKDIGENLRKLFEHFV